MVQLKIHIIIYMYAEGVRGIKNVLYYIKVKLYLFNVYLFCTVTSNHFQIVLFLLQYEDTDLK